MTQIKDPLANKALAQKEHRATKHWGAQRWNNTRFNWRAWGEQHRDSLSASFRRLTAQPIASIFTVAVLGLALSLPLLLAIALKNLEGLNAGISHSGDITVFFKPTTAVDKIHQWEKTVRADSAAGEVHIQNPDAGLNELKSLPGFGHALDALGQNPLPFVARIKPLDASGDAVKKFVARIQTDSLIDFVQYDQTWVDRLQKILDAAKRLVLIITLLFALGAVLIVGNTIRMDVQSRTEEINVMQSLGANNAFVRRPHLYAGAWYGCLGACLALIISAMAIHSLRAPIQQVATIYNSDLRLHGLTLALAAATLGIGIVLGWLGAWWTSTQKIAAVRLQ